MGSFIASSSVQVFVWRSSVNVDITVNDFFNIVNKTQAAVNCKGRNPLGELVGNPGWQLYSFRLVAN